jgi:hypothetical protein
MTKSGKDVQLELAIQMMEECKYCSSTRRVAKIVTDLKLCLEEDGNGNNCTRIQGHSGVHVSCDSYRHPVNIWNR